MFDTSKTYKARNILALETSCSRFCIESKTCQYSACDCLTISYHNLQEYEEIARAWDPVGWKWYDNVKNDPKYNEAIEMFFKDQIGRAKRVKDLNLHNDYGDLIDIIR